MQLHKGLTLAITVNHLGTILAVVVLFARKTTSAAHQRHALLLFRHRVYLPRHYPGKVKHQGFFGTPTLQLEALVVTAQLQRCQIGLVR
jgi:hypothetical protein